MTDSPARLLVTGGAGFIGSNLVHWLLAHRDGRVLVVDKLTYAGSLESLAKVREDPRFSFLHADIADRDAVHEAFREFRPTGVLNLAAESHVDRSIDDPSAFVQTNIVGTYELLEAARGYLAEADPELREVFRFLHVSTDEVYGSLGETGLFSEETPYAPSSPYAASKAAADHLVGAYHKTYGLPALITNCSNNYGPYQFPEKLIPLMILNALEGRELPIYGDGGHVRDWLFVEDHCAGLVLGFERGRLGEKYNIGGEGERTNLEIVDTLCDLLAAERPPAENGALRARGAAHYRDLKTFVPDRPGHDRRYGIDATRIRTELDWRPAHDLEEGLRETVRWYLENLEWCRRVQEGRYGRERLGLAGAGASAAPSPERGGR